MVIWCRWDGTLWYSRVAPLLLPYGSDFTGTQFHSLLLGSRSATTTVWSENRSIDSLRKATQETRHNHWNAAEMRWNSSLTMKGSRSSVFFNFPKQNVKLPDKIANKTKWISSIGFGWGSPQTGSRQTKTQHGFDGWGQWLRVYRTSGSEDLMDSSWVILFEVMPKKLVGNA